MTTRYLTKQEATLVRRTKTTVVEREMERLYKVHGRVDTGMLLEVARPETSPLHRYFEWNDGVAAEKYREHQALQLIMASKFVLLLNEEKGTAVAVSRESMQVRRLLPAFDDDGGFKMRGDILNEADARAALIDRKKRALRSWCRETGDIKELDALRAAILAHLEVA